MIGFLSLMDLKWTGAGFRLATLEKQAKVHRHGLS